MTPSVTMTQTFHNRQLSTFFDGCETLFCQLVGDMIQRGHVDVKNVPLGYLTVHCGCEFWTWSQSKFDNVSLQIPV